VTHTQRYESHRPQAGGQRLRHRQLTAGLGGIYIEIAGPTRRGRPCRHRPGQGRIYRGGWAPRVSPCRARPRFGVITATPATSPNASGGGAQDLTARNLERAPGNIGAAPRSRAGRTPRSPHSCSSAAPQSPITCGKCSSSSASRRATSSHAPSPAEAIAGRLSSWPVTTIDTDGCGNTLWNGLEMLLPLVFPIILLPPQAPALRDRGRAYSGSFCVEARPSRKGRWSPSPRVAITGYRRPRKERGGNPRATREIHSPFPRRNCQGRRLGCPAD